MNVHRCQWCLGHPLYIEYHDNEWGVPVHDDQKHFEFMLLDSAQAGLSWFTILNRREGYRAAYAGFDAQKVAAYNEEDVQRLLADPGIIRNRSKVRTSIVNAQLFLDVQAEFGSFDKYIWQFTDGQTIVNARATLGDIPATTKESDAMSKDLKKRGFKFVGSTIIYAYMQAAGMVNDHLVSCFRYNQV